MGDNIPLYFEATFEQQFLLHRLVMQDSHHRQEPIISSWGVQASFVYTNIYWCFHTDFLLTKERLFLQHIFSHWFCFCKPSPNISSHFRQVSSNSKTNLFPNTNYFLTLLNFTIWLLFILSPRSFQSRFHYFYTALILFKSPNLRRDLWNLQFICVEPPKLSIMFPIFSPATIHSRHLPLTTILLHFAHFLHLFNIVYCILPDFYIFFMSTSLSKFVMFSYFI